MNGVIILTLFLVSCSTFKRNEHIKRDPSSLYKRDCRALVKELMEREIPPPHPSAFPSKINHPYLYLWDNWGFKEEGVTHVYSLAASRQYNDRNRHFHVHWRHFTSTDDGKSWLDQGAVLTPRKGENLFDSQSIWSGTVTKMKNGNYIAAYSSLDPKKDFLQSISFAFSKDAHNFKRAYNGETPALSHELHREKFLKTGYYVDELENLGSRNGEINKSIQALRDPFIFEDNKGTIHLFWSAKSYDPNENVVSSIGHAIIKDFESPNSIELLPPIRPIDGETFTQLELPNVYQRDDGKFVWIIGTTQRVSEDQPEHSIQMAVRAYVSDTLNETLQPLKNDSILFYASEKNMYGANLIQDFSKEASNESPKFRLFNVGENNDKNFTLPTSISLDLD